MSTATMSIRIDPTLKSEATSILSQMGMTLSGAVNMFLSQLVRERALPFTPYLDVPNEETLRAMQEADRIAADPNWPRYTNLEDLWSDLEA